MIINVSEVAGFFSASMAFEIKGWEPSLPQEDPCPTECRAPWPWSALPGGALSLESPRQCRGESLAHSLPAGPGGRRQQSQGRGTEVAFPRGWAAWLRADLSGSEHGLRNGVKSMMLSRFL